MLCRIRARNIAIIDNLDLELPGGFLVMSGETGAGKSLILATVALLCGRKASPAMVRTGETQSEVEGLFDLGSLEDSGALREELGLDPDEHLLAFRRSIDLREGQKKEQVRIAGSLSTLKRLKELAGGLVDVASQHEQVRLLERDLQGAMLDRFGRLSGPGGRREVMARAHGAWLEGRARLVELTQLEQRRAERAAWLDHNLEDLEALAPKAGEETSLRERIKGLAHAVELGEALSQTVEELSDSDRDLVSRLETLGAKLTQAERWLPALMPLRERLGSAAIELKDLSFEFQEMLAHCEPDPTQLDRLQGRLAALERARLRHACHSDGELAGRLLELQNEREDLGQLEALLEQAQTQERQLRDQALAAAQGLHQERVTAAQNLERLVTRELADLAMGKARFKVLLGWRGEEGLTAQGADEIAFQLAANPGAPPADLKDAASGGELSRLLLALKSALRDSYPVPVYVFDEIDAGIGGSTAREVGRKLAAMSAQAQVICVTHLPQIAAFADHHFNIEKVSEEDRTRLVVTPLDQEQRVRELARMLSGSPDSPTALAHARELLEEATAARRIEP
jgi:DNA repair protein RecN (Recombination protein N)